MIFSAFIGSEYKPRPPGGRPSQTGERKRVQSRGNEQHGCKHENQSDLTLAGCIKGTQMRSQHFQSLKTFFLFQYHAQSRKCGSGGRDQKDDCEVEIPDFFLLHAWQQYLEGVEDWEEVLPSLGSLFLANLI